MLDFDDTLTLDLIRDKPDRDVRVDLMIARRTVGHIWQSIYDDRTGVYNDLMRRDPTWMADLLAVGYAISDVFLVLNREP